MKRARENKKLVQKNVRIGRFRAGERIEQTVDCHGDRWTRVSAAVFAAQHKWRTLYTGVVGKSRIE